MAIQPRANYGWQPSPLFVRCRAGYSCNNRHLGVKYSRIPHCQLESCPCRICIIETRESTDITAILHTAPRYARDTFVAAVQGLFKVGTGGGNSQDTSSCSQPIAAVRQGGAGVKYLDACKGLVNTGNLIAASVLSRIAFTCQNNASGGTSRPLNLDLSQPLICHCLKDCGQICFQSYKDRLCFRVSKAHVVFEHLGSISR